MEGKVESAGKYLEHLASQARKHRTAWRLVSQQTGTDESRKAKLQGALRFYDQEHLSETLTAKLGREPSIADLSPDLRDVVDQTSQDLQDYLLPQEQEAFRRTRFGLLPLSAVDAFCLDRTRWGTQLDGYIVILNEGLFICAQLLAKAFLLENLDGDLSQYKRPGADIRRFAVEHFLAPSPVYAGRTLFDDVPADIEGALAAAQMNMTVLLLQFVLLHEMGHVILQHHELMGAYRFHIAEAQDPPTTSTERFWGAERAADRFALERILARARSDTSRWANFLAIYIFFDWLDEVERVLGQPICPLHPPPQARGEALRQLMERCVPLDKDTKIMVKKGFEILASWSGQA